MNMYIFSLSFYIYLFIFWRYTLIDHCLREICTHIIVFLSYLWCFEYVLCAHISFIEYGSIAAYEQETNSYILYLKHVKSCGIYQAFHRHPLIILYHFPFIPIICLQFYYRRRDYSNHSVSCYMEDRRGEGLRSACMFR